MRMSLNPTGPPAFLSASADVSFENFRRIGWPWVAKAPRKNRDVDAGEDILPRWLAERARGSLQATGRPRNAVIPATGRSGDNARWSSCNSLTDSAYPMTPISIITRWSA